MGTKNFDNALDLITFSRASGGTYLDSDGVLQTASANVPRIEYDADGNLKGLLIEEQRTNLFLNSDSPETQVCSVTAGTAHTLGFTSGAATVDLDETILSTAVDVFVYDTSKDSDGGAWRTGALAQASSWYNETLNTATRGSRREFPAVAVIVLESNQLTIYDGDDPALPMWMVFTLFGNSAGMLHGNKTVAMLNGILVCGGSSSWQNGLSQLSFIEDNAFWLASNTPYSHYHPNPISGRNSGSYGSGYGGLPRLVNFLVNDVDMTVLPDAPIDPATGLPVPTIAVGSDGNGTYSTSIITNSGDVYDIASDSTGTAASVAFDGVSLSVVRSDGAVYVWDDVGSITADGVSPDATYSASSTPALLGTVSKVAA